jgi:hypothetical protein
MPKWIQDQALPTKNECPFTGWGSSFQAKCTQSHTSFPIDSIEHPVFLSESGSDSPTSPDMILGHDLIRKLGLDLKFNNDTPAIIWEDVEVATHGPSWTLDTWPKLTKPLQQFLNRLQPYDKQKQASKRKAQCNDKPFGIY